VDDLLILIESLNNISELLHEFKNISSKLNISVEPEDSNKINFLDDHLHETSQFHVNFHISKTNYNRLHDSPLSFPFI
jgi:hypothetical protein